MKYTNLFLLLVSILASCGAPATPAPTQTFTQESTPKSILEITGTPAVTVTPDPEMGNIEGDFSWLESSTSTSVPIKGINLKINGHTGSYPRYATEVDQNGHFRFSNIEPGKYGFGIYLNLPISERRCEAPEYIYGTDLDWLHYSTWLRGDIWHDIIFSSVDVTVDPGKTVVLNFVLECP
jgi:hypothetical protein